MTEEIWFTSDTHFGHESILRLGNGRPYGFVEQMNEALIGNWNIRVGPNDRVYFLGDFAFMKHHEIEGILNQLKGKIHYIRGNHDKSMDSFKDRFESYQLYKDIRIEDQAIALFHYPILEWNNKWHGAWHLHGHCHGNLKDDLDEPRMDIGVDCTNFAPISYTEIKNRMQERGF